MVYKKIAITVLLAVLVSCSTVIDSFDRGLSMAKMSFRKPGEVIMTHPDKFMSEFDCGSKKLPMLKIEENEVAPTDAKPGEEINHHMVYAMCPDKPSGVISGALVRRVYFKGRVIFEDVSKDFDFKPGRWAVDAFIGIPAEAESGVYSLEVEFMGSERGFKQIKNFIVNDK